VAILYFDNDMPADAGLFLRNRLHIVIIPSAIRATRFKDYEHLLNVKQRGAILITRDKDFRELHDAWRAWSASWNVQVDHPGILIAHGSWAHDQTAREIDAFLQRGLPMTTRLYEYRMVLRDWELRP
jgi:hypothetical protein